MKQIFSNYKGDHKSIYIIPLSDLHIGHIYHDREVLNQTLRFIDKNRNRCRIFLLGDLLEAATKTSPGRAVYDTSYNTQKQYEEIVEIFKPYADIIDVIITGNHEERIAKDSSIEILKEFAHRIDRPEIFAEYSSLVNVNVGNLMYSFFVWHGATGSTKEAGAINSMLSMREKALAHCYMMGHTHKLLAINRKLAIPNPDSDKATELEQLFVNTGTSLGQGGYADMKGYPLQDIGFGAVQIFADERKMIFHYIKNLI